MEIDFSKLNVSKLVDCTGDNCPMPLIKTRAAMMEAQTGDVIRVIGTHPQSFEEIPLILEVLEKEILEKVNEDNKWHITFTV